MCCYWQQHPHQVQRQLVPCSRQRFIILNSRRLLLYCVMFRCLQFAVDRSIINGVLRMEFFIVLISLGGRMLNVAIDYINNIISRLIQLTVQHHVTSTTDFFIFSVVIVITNISLSRAGNNNSITLNQIKDMPTFWLTTVIGLDMIPIMLWGTKIKITGYNQAHSNHYDTDIPVV